MLYEIAFLSAPWVAACLFLGFLGWMSYLVEGDEGAGATVSLLAFLGVMQAFTAFQPFSYALANPLKALFAVALYFGLGTVYSAVKWFSFVYKARDVYEECRTRYMQSGGLSEHQMQGGHLFEVRARAERKLGFAPGQRLPPQVGQHRDRIMVWMGYWPVSAFWTLFKDPVARICRAIFNQIGGALQAVSARAFAGFKDDFK